MFKIVMFGLLGIVGLVGITLAGYGISYLMAPIQGAVEAQRTITSGNSRIQRYEEFFNICLGVQAKEDAIDALMANSSMDTTKRDLAITANQSARGKLIAEYNSKSSMSYTSERFKASNLPYQLTRGQYNGNRTNCTL